MGSTNSTIRDSKGRESKDYESVYESKRYASSSIPNSTSPPPYSSSRYEVREIPKRAHDIPQWTWNNRQCREWIAALLMKGGKTQEEAEELAKKFDGFGPNLWLNNGKTYYNLFGASGQAIYAILMDVRGKPGAVPTTVKIPHHKVSKD